MPRGNPSPKLAITVDPDIHENILAAAARDGVSVSAWAEHKASLELGVVPLVPAAVVAQVSRSPQQAQLQRFLAACEVVPLGESEAHEQGGC
jgi:hypothetical protein